MDAVIESRELISVSGGGVCLRGTYHKPHHDYEAQTGRDDIRTGIFFLNSGFAPRAAGGDAAVYWAESFSKCGYPCFRFDLPGLGDSDGELPRKWLDFAHLVNTGYYAPSVSSAVNHVMERWRLSGVVLVGHCAGAVSAIYAAAISSHVKGLIALEPYFFREEAKRAQFRADISHWVTRNKLGGHLSRGYGHWKKASLRLRGNPLPENANLPLLRCWRQVASASHPMLILNARSPRSRMGDFDYFGHLKKLSGPGARVVIKFIDGANHSFADEIGKAAVQREAEQWLNSYFPLFANEKIAVQSSAV